MNEEHFFADVDLPFHVWVRERSGAKGYRWVLREAPHTRQGNGAGGAASGRERPPISPGPA
jgi:hypothetical protein